MKHETIKEKETIKYCTQKLRTNLFFLWYFFFFIMYNKKFNCNFKFVGL